MQKTAILDHHKERIISDIFRESVTRTRALIIIWRLSWWVIPWWRTIVGRSPVGVWVRWVVTTVWILETSTWGRVIIDRATSSRRRAVATTIIIIVTTARRASVAVTLTTRAVSTGWSTAVVVIGRIGSTRGRGTGTSSVTGNVRLSIGNAIDTDSLEFTAVKLFYCGLEIRSSLEFNKASLAIAVTTGFGVDDIEARLSSKVFQVL